MNSGCIAQTAKTPIADLAVPYPEPIDVKASAHAMPRNEKKDATMVQSSAAIRKTDLSKIEKSWSKDGEFAYQVVGEE